MRIIIYAVFVIFFGASASADFELTVEAGGVWQFRNDVNIPNESETNRFDFSNFSNGPFIHHRFESQAKINGRHSIRVVYAPLSLLVRGRLDRTIEFNDVSFDSSNDVEVNYKFNSYRLGYVYNWINRGKHKLDIGVTLKVRDADIRVSQQNTSANYDNLGLVPLLYLAYKYNLSDSLSLFTNADFATSSQGRAFDYTLKLRKKINKNYNLGVGYRVLEGGADNDKVFTFSLLHYATLDLNVEF